MNREKKMRPVSSCSSRRTAFVVLPERKSADSSFPDRYRAKEDIHRGQARRKVSGSVGRYQVRLRHGQGLEDIAAGERVHVHNVESSLRRSGNWLESIEDCLQ